ncbi:MAG: SDR family oxidoreductase [Bacteroidia bacterium]|jgi:NADP-dependent 3-hydroxy acid dehydrogenase YdfG|nr:SDR family oxidoreductase [Bacteroidia bacterium]MBP7261475.1 SDR family oxidoreductase [Bacteroidia bacterium]MBP9179121.1 SDR family oxidoreductase [Bacteroidia bacterium]MBP9723670.1 SDR family oxidoreductase [Bacteroidia bacterium]
MDLKNKIAIVTGISKGIGKATAQQLLNKGCKVAGLGRNAPDYTHENLIFISCDIRKHEQVEHAFELVRKQWGDELHILMNNAGLGYFGFLEDISYEQWDELFDTNVKGLFHCTKMALPQMKKQQYGHIINIASTAALEGMPQVSAYCGTKWAVKGISESLFREVRDFRIKVTCVYPGSTKTDFFRNSPGIQPHDYMLMPEDVALNIIQALEMPDNFHTVNLEIRPLQPKGPKA